jgi:hypothetical protein
LIIVVFDAVGDKEGLIKTLGASCLQVLLTLNAFFVLRVPFDTVRVDLNTDSFLVEIVG